jgi:hypothetical protein
MVKKKKKRKSNTSNKTKKSMKKKKITKADESEADPGSSWPQGGQRVEWTKVENKKSRLAREAADDRDSDDISSGSDRETGDAFGS